MKPLADHLAEAVAHLGAARALEVVGAWLDELSPAELAALDADWPGTWARPSQLFPEGPWRSHGWLTSRRFGKTRTCAEYVNAEAASGRAMRIGFAAQNLEKTLEVMVDGESGLLATAPIWFRPVFESGRVLWPNGAQAFPFTPEVPGAIRGPGTHLFWASELQSWPAAHRDEAWSNAQIMNTLGYGRTIWDATPKRRHPLLRRLLARAEASPHLHRVVGGRIEENALALGDGAVEELRKELDGTQRGREELDGEYLDQDDAALFRAEWFERCRRPSPSTFARRIISIDPAITADHRFSDRTGIVDMGLGADEQIYVCGNLTAVHRHEVWPGLVVDRYLRNGCDLIVIETNRGGNTHVALLSIAARERGLTLVELGPEERPYARRGVVYVRPHHTRRTKADRASAAASLVERGRVTFVQGAPGVADLEEALATFTGEGKGPDDAIDAFVHGCFELANLAAAAAPDPTVGFRGLSAAAEALRMSTSNIDPGSISSFLNTGRPSRGI